MLYDGDTANQSQGGWGLGCNAQDIPDVYASWVSHCWNTSQDAKVDLKPLIVSVIPIYSFSETINLFYYFFFVLIDKLITFSANYLF